MKIFVFLYLTNTALVAASYHVIRRGIPSRAGVSIGRGDPMKTQANIRSTSPRKVTAKATPNNGGDTPKPREDQTKRGSASVEAKGPAEVLYVDEQGINKSRYVSKGESAIRRSSYQPRPQASGLVKGPPSSGDTDLKIKAEGKYAGLIMHTGPGGSGHFKATGDGFNQESDVGPGKEVRTAAHIPEGGAKVEATISRPGSASVISFKSPFDIPRDGLTEIDKPPKEEKP